MSIQTETKSRQTVRRPGFSFLDWLGSFGTEDIGMDLGTSNVVIYVRKKQLIYPEASAVAVREKNGEMFAYGTRAEEMEGRTPGSIRIVHPLRDSAIIDYNATAYLLNSIINQSYLRSLFFHPRLIVSVPAGVTGVQRRALLEAAVNMGVRKAVLIDQPIAALLGMGVNTDRMQGAMVVDIGGGSANVSIVSRHGIVVTDSTYEAGLSMDQAVMTRVREKYKVQLGRQAAERLSAQILEELRQLDMGKIRFAVDIAEKPLSADGIDQVRFLMSANVGEELRPIHKIASGGELARIMLAMKNVLSEQDMVGTLVFDEVDTGVSGRAAQKVAQKLKSVAAHKQVLCVTHLPQLAAMADTHFSVEKGEKNGRTYTAVQRLDREQRRQELARLTGGSHVSRTMLDGAEELLAEAEKFRDSI